MRKWFLFLMMLFPVLGFTQVKLATDQPDFGLINKRSARFVDIKIVNEGPQKAFIFRMDAPKTYQILYSSKTLEPDSVQFIRIKYNPTEKGYFEDQLQLHLSNLNEPIEIRTKGYVEEFNPNSNPACPRFNEQSTETALNFELMVEVVEKPSGLPIHKATVQLIHNGREQSRFITNKNGRETKEIPLGLYYTVAHAEGYSSAEYPAYVNRNNHYLRYELERKEPTPVPAPNPPIIEDTTDFDEEIVLAPTPSPPDPPATPPANTPDPTEIIDTSDFSVNKFAPNNIVFCVDISTSMKYTGRLDLLKASMIELTEMLRPIDNITIVAYASNASVIMPTTSADNKQEIIGYIEALEAKGNTAGIEGMRLAYSQACNALIPNGNNEIIMATDGGFNKGEGSTKKLAAKWAKKNVKMSVVGIKVSNYRAVESMKNVSGYGKGVYIPIKTLDDARNSLVDEIKRQSAIHAP